MDYGLLNGKLYADQDWLGLSAHARELLVSLWSWAIDHERDDGIVSESVMTGLGALLGHGVGYPKLNLSGDRSRRPMAMADDTDPREAANAIESLITFDWIEIEGPYPDEDGYVGSFRLLRWEEQANHIRRAVARREKERERYLRRKAQKGGDD